MAGKRTNIALSAIVFFAVSLFSIQLPAQAGAGSGAEHLIESIKLADDRDDPVVVMEKFRELISTYPTETWRVGEIMESILLESDSIRVPGIKFSEAMDTIFMIYNSGISHDAENRMEWRLKKALLTIRHPGMDMDSREAATFGCFREDPWACPDVLVDEYFSMLAEEYKAGNLVIEDFMKLLSEWERLFASRLVMNRESGGFDDTDVREQVRRVLPPCEAINERYIFSLLDGKLRGDSLVALVMLVDLMPCDDFEMRKRMESMLVKQFPTAHWYRKLGGSTNDIERAIRYRREAIELERDSLLRASDHVKLAYLQKLTLDFTGARASLESAIALTPSWGVPHLHMAALMVTGASLCNAPEFERKAVYWAAIDHCEMARNIDVSLENEASKLLFEYRQKMPTAQDLSFRGLKTGDTYPLRCWMDVATTVKLF